MGASPEASVGISVAPPIFQRLPSPPPPDIELSKSHLRVKLLPDSSDCENFSPWGILRPRPVSEAHHGLLTPHQSRPTADFEVDDAMVGWDTSDLKPFHGAESAAWASRDVASRPSTSDRSRRPGTSAGRESRDSPSPTVRARRNSALSVAASARRSSVLDAGYVLGPFLGPLEKPKLKPVLPFLDARSPVASARQSEAAAAGAGARVIVERISSHEEPQPGNPSILGELIEATQLVSPAQAAAVESTPISPPQPEQVLQAPHASPEAAIRDASASFGTEQQRMERLLGFQLGFRRVEEVEHEQEEGGEEFFSNTAPVFARPKPLQGTIAGRPSIRDMVGLRFPLPVCAAMSLSSLCAHRWMPQRGCMRQRGCSGPRPRSDAALPWPLTQCTLERLTCKHHHSSSGPLCRLYQNPGACCGG